MKLCGNRLTESAHLVFEALFENGVRFVTEEKVLDCAHELLRVQEVRKNVEKKKSHDSIEVKLSSANVFAKRFIGYGKFTRGQSCQRLKVRVLKPDSSVFTQILK